MNRRKTDLNETSFLLDYQELSTCNRELAKENAKLKRILVSYTTSIKKSTALRMECEQALKLAQITLQTGKDKVTHAMKKSEMSKRVLSELCEDLTHLQGKFDHLLNSLNLIKKIPGDQSALETSGSSGAMIHGADESFCYRNVSVSASGSILSHIAEENNVPPCVGDLNAGFKTQRQHPRYSAKFGQVLPPSSSGINKGQRVPHRMNQMFVIEESDEFNRTCTLPLVVKSPTKVALLEDTTFEDSSDAMIFSPGLNTSEYAELDICRNNNDNLDSFECPSLSDIPLMTEEDCCEEETTTTAPYNLRKRKNQKLEDPFQDVSFLQDDIGCNESIVDINDQTFLLSADRRRVKNKKGGIQKASDQKRGATKKRKK